MEIKGHIQEKKKIQRVSVVDQVYEAIKKDIIDNVWAVGEKIPSESELADIFSVNRLSVRMALQKLNTLGFIETRVGEGSFVSRFSIEDLTGEISDVYLTDEHRADMEQLRNLLEGECMNIAIQRATTEQKDELKARLDEYKRLETIYNNDNENDDLLDELVDADFAFHYEIICMSGNHLYMAVYKMIEKMIKDHIRYLLYTRSHNSRFREIKGIITHDKMYDSIVNGDPEAARESRELMLGILPQHPKDHYAEIDPIIKEKLQTR